MPPECGILPGAEVYSVLVFNKKGVKKSLGVVQGSVKAPAGWRATLSKRPKDEVVQVCLARLRNPPKKRTRSKSKGSDNEIGNDETAAEGAAAAAPKAKPGGRGRNKSKKDDKTNPKETKKDNDKVDKQVRRVSLNIRLRHRYMDFVFDFEFDSVTPPLPSLPSK